MYDAQPVLLQLVRQAGSRRQQEARAAQAVVASASPAPGSLQRTCVHAQVNNKKVHSGMDGSASASDTAAADCVLRTAPSPQRRPACLQ